MNKTCRIKLGISTCPNDTFAFHAILSRRVDMRGLEFDVQLVDVQELNERLTRGEFDVAKASFHAALLLIEQTVVLSSGSALGFGVGPILLSKDDAQPSDRFRCLDGSTRPARVLCPGALTTATMLYRMFYPRDGELEQVVFSDIIPRLMEGTADFGVCIHEGRFTWEASGLRLATDLGRQWEQTTKCALPLGGILARRSLGEEILNRIQWVIRDSIVYARDHRAETVPTMRRYAQEFSDEVLFSHVDLYVNRETVQLTAEGRRALQVLFDRAIEAGLVPSTARPLTVLENA